MVDTGGLENRLARKGYGGSNPSPSAIQSLIAARSLRAVQKPAQMPRFRDFPDPERDWRRFPNLQTAPAKPILSRGLERGPFRGQS